MITIRSGLYKNKRLVTSPDGVRPTSDKIRQAIFNILAHAAFAPPLAGAALLDAFAGTGAMGLEALSRGAAQAWFMENNSAVRNILAQNLSWAGDGAVIVAADAAAPPLAPQEMDFVFLDPPYGKGLLPLAVAALHRADWIGGKTLLVIESDAEETFTLPENFEALDARKYGRTFIRFAKLRG